MPDGSVAVSGFWLLVQCSPKIVLWAYRLQISTPISLIKSGLSITKISKEQIISCATISPVKTTKVDINI